MRYGRLGAVVASVLITLVSVLGGTGALPDGPSAAASEDKGGSSSRAAGPSASLAGARVPDTARSLERTGPPAAESQETQDPPVPEDSGSGRRVVFDMSDQRVWLVESTPGGGENVLSTYLVSGSLLDNLQPGTFEVYSRSRWATGIDDSGKMEYFVRFTRGANAAIGFHSIPTKDGRPLQRPEQLGTPQSHGCIRQARPDARRLWAFAPVGTKVVVTA